MKKIKVLRKQTEKDKKYSVAIIGAGWSGLSSCLDELRIKPASHAEAVSSCNRTKLSACVDTDQSALELAKKLYPKAQIFNDSSRMFNDIKPEIVIISTHPETHCKYIEEASRAGVKAVLCEKPISYSVAEAKRAVAIAKKNGIMLFVNHIRRFDPLIRRFRDYVGRAFVKNTFIGKIKLASAYYNKDIFHDGTHYIDLLRFFLGEAGWVTGVSKDGEKKTGRYDCLIGFKSGAVASLQYFDSSQYLLSEVSFFGESGRIDFKHSAGLTIETVGIRSYKDVSGYKELDYENKNIYGKPRSFFSPQIPHIIDCIEGGDNPISTGEDALKVLQIIASIEKSAKLGGKKVKL